MGFRDTFLNHAGLVSRHHEITVHALEELKHDSPINLLLAGVGNGGDLEIWPQLLPQGSRVLGIDKEPATALLGHEIALADVLDREAVKQALRGSWFNLVIDCTETMTPWLWAFLRPGGKMILENYRVPEAIQLVEAVARDEPSWLPVEEILKVDIYPHVLVICKRSPRVVPYLDVIAGNFADVTGEPPLLAEGAKWVLV